MASRVEELSDRYARQVVLPRTMDSYVAGEGKAGFEAGMKAVLDWCEENRVRICHVEAVTMSALREHFGEQQQATTKK